MPPFFFRELQVISFSVNLQFLYELKHKARLSKTMCGIFHFRFCFVFIKVYVFVQQIACTLTLTHHNFFHNQNNRRTTHSFAQTSDF